MKFTTGQFVEIITEGGLSGYRFPVTKICHLCNKGVFVEIGYYTDIPIPKDKDGDSFLAVQESQLKPVKLDSEKTSHFSFDELMHSLNQPFAA